MGHSITKNCITWNRKCQVNSSPTTELALRDRSDPRHEPISHNSDDTDDPKHPCIIRAAVAVDQQEDDAAEIARRAGHAGDETCDVGQLLMEEGE